MTAKVKARQWSDVCAGDNCGKKDTCRRHTYYMLLEVTTVEQSVWAEHHRCPTDKAMGTAYIALQSDEWELMPEWWDM